MSRSLAVGATCLLCFACGGNITSTSAPNDGGLSDRSSSGSSSGGSSGGSSGSSGSSSGGADAAANPLSGKYTGYIESFMFPDGSDVVVMNLSFAGDGTITGTVYFGTGTPLAPATDPNVGYPPGFTGGQTPLEGFEFTIIGGTYTAPRVQLSIQSTELWKQWCEIQTMIYPQYNSASTGCGPLLGYGCLPNVGFMGGASGCSWTSCDHPNPTPIDCGKLSLCTPLGGVCTCTMTACTVPTPAKGDIAFDMQLASGKLDGSVTGLGALYNVHLTQQ